MVVVKVREDGTQSPVACRRHFFAGSVGLELRQCCDPEFPSAVVDQQIIRRAGLQNFAVPNVESAVVVLRSCLGIGDAFQGLYVVGEAQLELETRVVAD